MNKQEFIGQITNWNNHRTLLWQALKNTTGKVVEFGCGEGSTEILRTYCKENGREFISFDSNKEWADKFNSKFVEDWDKLDITDIDVLFIDHAPGERRHIDMEKYSTIAKVIVIHDSEPEAPGYMLDKIWHLFPYKLDWVVPGGAWTTLVSNHFNVYTFSKDLEDYHE